MATAVASVTKKKTATSKKPKSASSHPPFLEMITDAIATLKERTGSSQYAITKFIEEKHKQLPSNFRNNLLVQLKKFVASGKLVKVKASFKIPSAKSASTSVAAAKTKPKTAKTAAKPKPKAKGKVATPVKAKAKTAVKPKTKAKPAAKPTKVAKTAKKSSPGKKVKTPMKKKAVVVAKKPKSVKSPAKKAAPKKAKK